MTITGPTMPSSLPTTMSRSRTGDASSGTSVPFSFSCVKVEAMSATPESAGMSVLCSARTSIEMSLGPPGPVPRPLSTKRIGSSAKKPVRMIAPRSPKISQRISRQAMSAALPIEFPSLRFARFGDDREVRVFHRPLFAHERDHAQRHEERAQRARGLGIERGGGLVEEEHRRVVHEAARDRDLLLHTARERAEADVEPVGEAEQLREFLGALAGGRDVVEVAEEA